MAFGGYAGDEIEHPRHVRASKVDRKKDDLQTLLQRAQGIATDYSASTKAIGQQLRAAHSERAKVKTTDLVGPLRDAYDEVDKALAEADTAFLRYQDVRQVLSDFLGVRLPN